MMTRRRVISIGHGDKFEFINCDTFNSNLNPNENDDNDDDRGDRSVISMDNGDSVHLNEPYKAPPAVGTG